MTWAQTEAQKAIFKKLSNDSALMTLLGASTEVQRMTLSGTPASGSFKLNYAGQTTAVIDGATLNAAAIQTALRLLTGLSEITVALFAANVYDVSFVGVAGDLGAMTASDNTMQTVAPAAVSITIVESAKGKQKVFDFVPDNTEYPYIVLQIMPWTDRGNHTYEGWGCEYQITTWHRKNNTRGNLAVQTIQKRIDELLHKDQLCIDGWNVISHRRTLVDIITDDDNVTKQGIQRFNLLTGEG